MSPSAVSTTQCPVEAHPKGVPPPEGHVHGSEDKTPLQAICHGILMDGKKQFIPFPINHGDPSIFSPFTYLMPGIPNFSSYAEHRRHVLIHTAATFRDFSRKGFSEGQSGHISVRDPEFEHYIWMNPLGKHYGLMTAGDLICLDVNTGTVVGGNNVRTASQLASTSSNTTSC